MINNLINQQKNKKKIKMENKKLKILLILYKKVPIKLKILWKILLKLKKDLICLDNMNKWKKIIKN